MPEYQVDKTSINKNVFAETQDMAYMVKELVQDDLYSREGRPNVIIDGISLDRGAQKMLGQSEEVTSVVAAYRGEPGFVGIAERADNRARDVNAGPADKGRFVNTESLLEGHANFSNRLLTSVPKDVVTIVYDTHVTKGDPAREIGKINTSNNILEIQDLRVFSEFLNKQNINQSATHPVELIYRKDSSMLSSHPEYKAAALLNLGPENEYKPPFSIHLKDNNNLTYAIIKSTDGKPELDIKDIKIFDSKSRANTIEGGVLRSITRQVNSGGMKESLESCMKNGDEKSFLDAYNNITQHKGNLDSELKRIGNKLKVHKSESTQSKLVPTNQTSQQRGLS